MTVVLTILKAAGILLLAVLGVLLACLLLVLFVPFRYGAQGEYRGKLSAGAHVTWLFRFLAVRVSYAEALSWSVRIAGFRILHGPDTQEKGEKRGALSGTGAPEETGGTESDAGSAAKAAAPSGAESGADAGESAGVESGAEANASADAERDPSDVADAGEALPDGAEAAADGQAEAGNGQEEEPDAGDADSLSGRFAQFFRRLEDSIQNAEEKLDGLSDRISWYLELLEREDTRIAVGTVFRQAFRILRHVMPRELRADFVVGTGDPAADGRIAAWQGMLYPVLHDKVLILPDFEKKRAEGSFFIKGRITVFSLLICGLAVILKKEVRLLIGRLRKKEEKKDGRKS